MLRRFTRVEISDFGCAFNAYRRTRSSPCSAAIGRQKFTKALILSTGASVVEVDVGTCRAQGDVALLVAAADAARAPRARGLLAAADPVGRRGPRRSSARWPRLVLGVCGVVYWIGEANFPGPLFLGAA